MSQLSRPQRAASLAGILVGILTFFFLGLLLIVFAGVWACSRPERGIEYTVLFKDAQGLRAKDPVVLAGIDVGEVRKVAVAPDGKRASVTLFIRQAHAGTVKAPPDTSARIETGGVLFATRRVVIVNRGEGVASVTPGSVVDGLESRVEQEFFEAKDAATKLAADAKVAAGKIGNDFKQAVESAKAWANGPEAKAIQKDIETLQQNSAAWGSAQIEAARKNLDEMMARSRTLADDLAKGGESTAAEDIQRQLSTWRAAAEKATADLQKQLSTPPKVSEAAPLVPAASDLETTPTP